MRSTLCEGFVLMLYEGKKINRIDVAAYIGRIMMFQQIYQQDDQYMYINVILMKR